MRVTCELLRARLEPGAPRREPFPGSAWLQPGANAILGVTLKRRQLRRVGVLVSLPFFFPVFSVLAAMFIPDVCHLRTLTAISAAPVMLPLESRCTSVTLYSPGIVPLPTIPPTITGCSVPGPP